MLPLSSRVAAYILSARAVIEALSDWAAKPLSRSPTVRDATQHARLERHLRQAIRAALHRELGGSPLHQLDGALSCLGGSEPLVLAACDHLAGDLLFAGRDGPSLVLSAALRHQRVAMQVAPDHLWAAHLTADVGRGQRPLGTDVGRGQRPLSSAQVRAFADGPLLPSMSDPVLVDLKRRGLAELHRHFNGSGLPGLLWSRLMVAGLALPIVSAAEHTELRRWVELARRLRALLVDSLRPQRATGQDRSQTAEIRRVLRLATQADRLLPTPSPPTVLLRQRRLISDPAARLGGADDQPLFTERALLLRLFESLRAGWSTHHPAVIAAAHAYVCIRNQVQTAFSQPAQEAVGLDRFEKRYRAHPLRDPAEEALALPERLVQAVRVGGVHWLEARLTPSGAPAAKIRRLLRAADERRHRVAQIRRSPRAADERRRPGRLRLRPVVARPGESRWAESRAVDHEHDLPALGVIFHFIRRRPPEPPPASTLDTLPRLRFARLRSTVAVRARRLEGILSNPELAPFFVGLDIAGVEIDAPVEVFAPAIRRLRRLSGAARRHAPAIRRGALRPSLGVTCHAGEEFHHIVGGLRSIAEAVEFLDMGPGDRIGHGLAAGLDVQQWMHARGGEVVQSVGSRLDDLVWLRSVLGRVGLFPEVCASLEEEIGVLGQLVYGQTWPWSVLHRAWQARRERPTTTDSPAARWLRSPPPRTALKTDVERCHEMYLFDVPCRRRANKIKRVMCRSEWVPAITAAQEYVVGRLVHSRIAIEVNPTSNLAISHIAGLHEHPIFRWNGPSRADDSRARPVTVVCTDNPGVCSTELIHEYAYLARAAEERGTPPHLIADWLESLRRDGLRYSFVRRGQRDTGSTA